MKKVSYMKNKLLLIIGAFLFYFLGSITVYYKLFPFSQILELKKSIKDTDKPEYMKNWKYPLNVNIYKIYETKNTDIVMLGDSITYRVNWNELFNMPIVNRGIDSDTTTGFIHRMDLIYKLNPKKVFIMGGINDIMEGYTVDKIFSNYKIILQNLLERNITPYVQSTLLTSRNNLNIHVKELNILLKEYCDNNKITFINLNKKLSHNDKLLREYTHDGLHLNSHGYTIWKQVIARYLNE